MPNQTIAILGRPNVGKSTLFNRIVKEQKSIVSPIEGVTRDRVYGVFDWNGSLYNLIDTGGYVPDSEDLIDNKVRLQAEIAFEESDAIILLMDGRSVLTSSDLFLAKELQKSGKPFVLAINKIDKIEMENFAIEFYQLGLGEYFTLSAQNNRRIGDLLDAVIKLLPINQIPESYKDNDFSLAIIGMPNVGKSSLMNRLLEQEKSIVTPIAGTTRDSVDSYINYYKKTIRIIDTAGLRRKSKISDNIEYYSTVRTNRIISDCDIAAVLIDAGKGFTNQDRDIIRQVIDTGKALMIVVNKWDLVEKDTTSLENFKKDILDYYPSLFYYPILFISILHNLRVRSILKQSLNVYKERSRKVKTVELNKFLKQTIQRYPPPVVKNKNISIKYATQVHHSPPIFAFFSNYPDLISVQYKRYLENSLREYFGFLGTPIKISFRKGD